MESSSALPSDWNSFLSEAVAKPQDSHVNFAMSYIAKDSSLHHTLPLPDPPRTCWQFFGHNFTLG